MCSLVEESLPVLCGSLRYGRPVRGGQVIGKTGAPTQPSAQVTDGNGVGGQDTRGGGRLGGMGKRVMNRKQEGAEERERDGQ